MKSTFARNISFELKGQASDSEISIIINDLPVGFVFDINAIKRQLAKLQGKQTFNTPRQKDLNFHIKSGIKYLEDDFCKITNSQIEVIFEIENTIENTTINPEHPRPGHIDYVAMMKYPSHDIQNGGHFSGQLMMPLVFVGFLYRQLLKKDYPHLKVYSHIKKFLQFKDITYYELRKHIIEHLNYNDLTKYNHIQLQMLSKKLYENLHSVIKKGLNNQDVLPTFNKQTGQKMIDKLSTIKNDTVGGEIETIIINPPASLGDPLFYSAEAIISQMMYSIPSIKGVTFGNNYRFINKMGSQVKDEIIYIDQHKITTLYNNNAGINGGITNGEDIVFSTTLKPIPSLAQAQQTYSIAQKKIVPLTLSKQYDITIINRIIPIIDAMSYIAIYDLIKKPIN